MLLIIISLLFFTQIPITKQQQTSISNNNNNAFQYVDTDGYQFNAYNQQKEQILQYNQLYQNIQQDDRSIRFYNFTVLGKNTNQQTTLERQIGIITAIRVDIEFANSDPEIYISKVNQYPTSEQDSEQQCLNVGSKVCILDNSKYKAGDIINIGIRCMNYCLYSLKVQNPTLNTLSTTQGQQTNITTQFIESRSISIFLLRIPVNSTDNSGPTQQVLFQFISYAMSSQVELYFSTSTDFTQLHQSLGDQIIDGGKALKFTSNDIGFCTNCNIYLIASVRIGAQYIIKVSTSSSLTFIQDQVPLERNFKSQQFECLAYNLIKAVNDAVIQVNQYQGDVDITLYYRNLTNDDIDVNNMIMISEIYQNRLIIIRSMDRQRLGPAGGLIYMCIHAFSDASFTIRPSQQYTFDRYDLQDETLATFILDPKDSVYFRYTSPSLANQVLLNITLQSYNYIYGIPRIYYQVCQSSNIDDCSLTESQQSGIGMIEVSGSVDNIFKTRTAQINHSPSNCQQPTSCIYLISVFNFDLSNPLKTSFKITPTSSEPRQVQLFQNYYDMIDQGGLQYFTVVLTPKQISTLQFTSLIVNVTAYNGQVELYASNVTKNPSFSNSTYKSRSQSPWQSIVYNVTGIDIISKSIYFGVYGNVRTTYKITFGGEYTDITKSQYINPQQTAITQLQNGQIVQASLDPKNTQNSIQYSVQPVMENNMARNLIVIVQVTGRVNNVILQYDVNYGAQNWYNLQGNQSIPGAMIRVKDNTQYQITFRLIINGTISNNAPQYNFTIEIQQAGKQSSNILDASLDTEYTLYTLEQSKKILIKQLLIDTNGTYGFTVTYLKGVGTMLYKTSSESLPNFNKDDQSTYQLQGMTTTIQNNGANEVVQNIQTDRAMREGNNLQQCRNASYPIRGGNNNCTMWIAIQCEGICIVKFTSTLQQAKSRPMMPPTLVKYDPNQAQNYIGQGTLMRGKYDYYYMPFTRGKIDPDFVIMLNKANNDSVLVAKLIFNGYLNYFNWSYPTNTSADLIARSNLLNDVEFIEVNSALLNKCQNNTSCVLIIGVMGNGLQNISNSSYNLSILSPNNKINQEIQFNDYIEQANTVKYYWFIMNNIATWKQTFSLKVNSLSSFANLYINANKPTLPTDTLYDYKSEQLGPDYLYFTNNDFKQFRQLPRILIMIGVKSYTPKVNYTLYSQGPFAYNSTFLNIIDLQAGGRQVDISLQSLNRKATNNYQMFRYFNYGSRDLSFNISCNSGAIYYIVSNQSWQMTDTNIYYQLPRSQQSSQIIPVNMTKSQRMIFNINPLNQTTSPVLCQFCWYYISVFQNSTDKNAASSFSINIVDNIDIKHRNITNLTTSAIDIVKFNRSGQIIRKFQLHYRKDAQIVIQNLTNMTQTYYQAILIDNVDALTAQNILQLQNLQAINSSTSGSAVIVINMNKKEFKIGQYYYLFLSTNSTQNITLSLSLQQDRDVTLLKERQNLVQQLQSPVDFIRFYYYLLPKLPANYTANLTLNVLTPGYMPSIYLHRNDIINGSFMYGQMEFPNIIQNRFLQEPNFLNADTQRQFSMLINMTSQNYNLTLPVTTLQNVTFSVTTLQNVSTTVYDSKTKKNVTTWSMKNVTNQVTQEQNVTRNVSSIVLNQTLYTIAVYWNNFGLTDYQKAEYEIQLTSNLSTSLSRFLNTNINMQWASPSDLSKIMNNKFSYGQTTNDLNKQFNNIIYSHNNNDNKHHKNSGNQLINNKIAEYIANQRDHKLQNQIVNAIKYEKEDYIENKYQLNEQDSNNNEKQDNDVYQQEIISQYLRSIKLRE